MNKIFQCTVALMSLLFAFQTCAATWSAPISVVSLQTTRIQSDVNISITGTCVDNLYAYMGPNEDNHKEVLSIALVAMTSSKKVKLLCSDSCASTDRCRVLDIEVIN